MQEVTLPQMLAARDERAAAQRELLAARGLPLLSLTMNIPGPVKRTELIAFAFRAALEELRLRLGDGIVEERRVDRPTGPEALLVCRRPAAALKALAVELESACPAGRLLDVDVIGLDGRKLSREIPRRCLLCGGPAAPCARSRAHGLPALQMAVEELLRDFAADRLGDWAVEALAAEAELTPKPGLVDAGGSGAHRDMDLPLFLRSAQALGPYFREAAALGMERPDCMLALQTAGREAEAVMLSATGGVNTHRGAVYAFGLTLAALGSALVRGGEVWRTAADLAAAGAPPPPSSHGSAVGARYGAAGARGEAMSGFPHARRALAALRAAGPYRALLTLLAEVEDTNLLHRGGMEGLRLVQGEARRILAGPPEADREELAKMDELCVARNLSPGGSADLLALAFLLRRVEGGKIDDKAERSRQ